MVGGKRHNSLVLAGTGFVAPRASCRIAANASIMLASIARTPGVIYPIVRTATLATVINENAVKTEVKPVARDSGPLICLKV